MKICSLCTVFILYYTIQRTWSRKTFDFNVSLKLFSKIRLPGVRSVRRKFVCKRKDLSSNSQMPHKP